MNADGSDVRRVTDQIKVLYHKPTWSSDGKHIAFEAKGVNDTNDIYVINLVTSMIVNITNHSAYDGHPSWSPDGRKIAFVSDRDVPPLEHREIYTMDPDGGNVIRLSDSPESVSDPDWSPDGSKIVYTQYTNQAPVVCVINSDGSGQIQLLEGGFDGGSHPSWSQDGTSATPEERVGVVI